MVISEAKAKSKIKLYLKIMVWLTILTVVEIFVPKLSIGKTSIGWLLVIFASVKAAIVGWYYMHLSYETSWLKWVAVSPLIAAFYAGVLILEAPSRPYSEYYSAPKRVVKKLHHGEGHGDHKKDSHDSEDSDH